MAKRNKAERLRNAVYAMPSHTKEAMLRGIRGSRVIVGAYVDKRGGVCPMLAAHRNGGRTNFGTFARAWDAYTDAGRKSRRASRREVRTLEGYLEMALIREGIAVGDSIRERPLADEVRDVKATRRRLAEADAQEGSETSIQDVLATAYAEHALATDPDRTAPHDTEPDSVESWSAEMERAEAELQSTGR